MKTVNLIIGFLFLLNNVVFSQSEVFTVDAVEPTGDDTLVMPLQGVISGPLPPPGSPLPNLTPQLQDIGVLSIRNNGYYNDMLDMEAMFRCTFADTVPSWNCSPDDSNNYHFASSDTLFRAIRDGGFELYFRLGGEPQSALPDQQHVFHGPQDTVAENNLIRAMVKVVEHYDHFEGNSNLLEYLNVWTEWPNVDFWERPDNEFIHFFIKAVDTLKKHFPDKKIGGPGLLVPTIHVLNGDATMANKAVRLLKQLFLHNVRPDFISWHMWQLNTESYYKAGEQYRDLLDGVGDFASVPWAGTGFFDGVEIYCDAWGLPQMDDEGNPLPFNVLYQMHNKKKGAAMLTADWIALQQTNTKKAYYYRYADPHSYPDSLENYVGWTGLFYGDSVGTYKPSAHAFRLWSALYQEFPLKMDNEFPLYNNDSLKLWVLSAKNPGGAYGFLVANTDNVSKNFKILIDGNEPDTSNYDFVFYRVNNSDIGIDPVQVYENNFMIEGENVLLVKVLPKNYVPVLSDAPARKVSIYPNPLKEKLYLLNVKNCFVDVYHVNGSRMIHVFSEGERMELNMGNFPSGIYFVKIYDQNEKVIASKKVVKE